MTLRLSNLNGFFVPNLRGRSSPPNTVKANIRAASGTRPLPEDDHAVLIHHVQMSGDNAEDDDWTDGNPL